ncbi:MAG: hypothetical protein ABIF71_07240 [Planctomycetota bacterium]
MGFVICPVSVRLPGIHNSMGSVKKVINNDRGLFTIIIPRLTGTVLGDPANGNAICSLTVVARVIKHILFNLRWLPVSLGMCTL